MAKVKKLLKRCEIQTAVRKRTCKRTSEKISAGEKCIVVWDSQYDKKPYSKKIALEMIRKAHLDLDELEQLLNE